MTVESKKKHDVKEIMSQFDIPGDFVTAAPYGSGHINDTYAAVTDQGGTSVRYIVQRINHFVFRNPPELMDNIERVTKHIREKIKNDPHSARHVLTLIPTLDGRCWFQDRDGNYWRIYIFVENTKSYDVIENSEQAFQGAKAFGEFQKDLVDLPGKRLNDTIPDFHNTPQRFRNLEKAVKDDAKNRAKSAKKEIDFIFSRKGVTEKLLNLSGQGLVPERVTHNDTKLNNVLFDEKTGEGKCVIDLDTVMPGLALYDFGDLIRTSTSPAAEDEKDLSKIKMQMDKYDALVKGYLTSAKDFLTKSEVDNLAFSGKLITLEIGMRFLTDHLSGDVYFKIHREGHNLDRCRTQLRLVECIEELEDEMNAIAANFRKK